MKRLMMVATLAMAQAGCVAGQGDAPVQFSQALGLAGAPGEDCTTDTSKFLSQGRLNLSGGSNYLLAMRVRTTIPSARPVTIGGSNTSVGGESVTLTEYVYSYEGPAYLNLPKEETVATYTVLAAGGSTDAYVFLNAFGPQALSKLNASSQVGQEPVGVISTIKGRGTLGTSSHVESNEFSFPILVTNSGCTTGTLGGICNVGQDAACTSAAQTP